MLNCFSNNPTDIKIEEDPFKSFNLYKANWIDIEKELDNFDWDTLFNEASVDEMVDILEEKVLDTLKTHAPLKKKIASKRYKNVPRDRNILIKKCRRINSRVNYLKYVKKTQSTTKIEELLEEKFKLEEKIRNSIECEDQKKEEKIISKIKINPKAFYAYAKSKSKTKSKIGPLSDKEGKLQSDSQIMTNILQDQYVKVFSNPNKETEFKTPNQEGVPPINDIEFSPLDFEKAIKLLPTNAASGPDKFPAIT